MGILDDLLAKISKTEAGQKAAGVAAEKAAEASAAAATKAAEVALDGLADDMEKHFVGDLDEVNEMERELEAKARAREELRAENFRKVHEERMSREERAKKELAELKAKLERDS